MSLSTWLIGLTGPWAIALATGLLVVASGFLMPCETTWVTVVIRVFALLLLSATFLRAVGWFA